MNASEVIQRLQSLIETYGDLDIRIYNSTESEFDESYEIEPRRILPDQRGTDEERKDLFFGIDAYATGDWEAQLRYDGTEHGFGRKMELYGYQPRKERQRPRHPPRAR